MDRYKSIDLFGFTVEAWQPPDCEGWYSKHRNSVLLNPNNLGIIFHYLHARNNYGRYQRDRLRLVVRFPPLILIQNETTHKPTESTFKKN